MYDSSLAWLCTCCNSHTRTCKIVATLFYLIARETRRANNGTTTSVDRCNTTFGYCHSNVSSAICLSSSVVRVHSNKTAVAIVMRLLLKYIIIRNVSFLFFMKKNSREPGSDIGRGGPVLRPPTNRRTPTKQFQLYFSLMISK